MHKYIVVYPQSTMAVEVSKLLHIHSNMDESHQNNVEWKIGTKEYIGIKESVQSLKNRTPTYGMNS